MFQPEEDSSFNLVWNIKHNLFALNLYSYVGTSNFCKEMLKSRFFLGFFLQLFKHLFTYCSTNFSFFEHCVSLWELSTQNCRNKARGILTSTNITIILKAKWVCIIWYLCCPLSVLAKATLHCFVHKLGIIIRKPAEQMTQVM